MKKSRLLNSEISYEIAKIGHTQQLVIGDCGLPIPAGVKRIDLAVTDNIPGFLETLDAVLSEMQIEGVTLAEEIHQESEALEQAILQRFPGIPVRYVSHEAFKTGMRAAVCVVRTGEKTPYANIILQSGVNFS